MRIFRSAGLVLIVVLAGLLSGAAAGAETTATALISAAAPAPVAAAPQPAVVVPVAAAAPQPAAPAPAPAPVAAPPKPAAAPVPVAAAPVAAAVPAAVPVPGTPCLSTAKACIKLSTNQSWLIKDGAIAYGPVPITHGRAGWTTPPGTFNVTFKNRYHRSTIFNNAPMPYSVFFNGGIAFHEGSLREKSHGCIHLSPAAAQTYFANLNKGDVVQVVR